MSVVTEAELFAAYRFPTGYAAQCGCGTWISAPSSATPIDIDKAVALHNASTDHQQWVSEWDAVEAMKAPRHVCICKGDRS